MESQKEYKCRKCEKVFNHSGNCHRHERKCNPDRVVEVELSFVCTKSWCEKVFLKKSITKSMTEGQNKFTPGSKKHKC